MALNPIPEKAARQRISAAELPWLMLVKPSLAWRWLGQSGYPATAWAACLFAQWLLLGSAQLAALQASYELSHYAGLTSSQIPLSMLSGVWQLAQFALGIAIGNLLIAVVVWGLSTLIGIRAGYPKVLTLCSYSLLPAVLGHSLATLVFAITQPLTRQAGHALALLIRPFPIGLGSVSLFSTEPLSLAWVFTSYCDIFSWWSLALLFCGCLAFLRISLRQAAWLVMGVVLSLGVGLTAWWRVLQLIVIR
jgi:hypothetical protein